MVQMMSGVRQMAGIQRFVTYIYAYENGEKTSNTGYAKLEIRGSNGRMEIHFSGDSATGRLGKVFFLYPDNGELKDSMLFLRRLCPVRSYLLKKWQVFKSQMKWEENI